MSAATLDAGPFVRFYYDSELYIDDLTDAMRRVPTSDYIHRRSTSKNYMASKGYIEQGDYAREMAGMGCYVCLFNFIIEFPINSK